MFRRLFAGALVAGLSADVLAALLQLAFVVPLIQEAEHFETGALPQGAAEHDHAQAAPLSAAPVAGAAQDHGDSAQGPTMRTLGTVGFFLVSYTGFALVMIAGFALAERAGHPITARTGVIWGLCGFLAVQLAPAFGLPPKLPGAHAADLAARQLWWAGCILSTVVGLTLLAFGRNAVTLALGGLAIILPHLIGAPMAAYGGVVPPDLAAHFVARALGAGALCWALLGTIAGVVWERDD